MKIPFVGPTYQSRSTNIACDRCINFYPEINRKEDKEILTLFGTPGTLLFSTAIANPIRGMHTFNNLLFIVAGTSLYSINGSGTISSSLGTLNTATGRVSMSDNGLASAGVGGNQLAIADGSNFYTYNVSTLTFATSSQTLASFVTYIDGYFVVNKVGTMSGFASNLYDGTTWNGLATAQISAAPDLVQCVINIQQQLWFIKEYSTEVWYDTGVATSVGFPFTRIGGTVLDYGTSAPWTVARGDNSLFWLANQRIGDQGELVGVVELSAYTPAIITPPQILFQWQQYATTADAFGYCYAHEGHTFYVITFPTGNATWVYDTTTQMWHERSTYTSSSPSSPGRHIGNCYAFFNGKHLIGDWQNGNIYQLSTTTYTDNGQPIISTRIAPHVYDRENLENLFLHRLVVDMETGVGQAAGTPTSVTVSISIGSPAIITAANHGVAPNDIVIFNTTGALPTGLTAGVAYYVLFAGFTATTFEVSASRGGTPVTTTGTQSGVQTVSELTTVQNPQASLSWSDDGGHKWSNEYLASVGRVGSYKTRLIWRRLGYSRDRVFKLVIADPVKKAIIGGYLE